jgi:glutaminyl-tRNA synthetase
MSNFITDIVDADLESGKHSGVVTRFPPEPNGYIHIGHAKSICLNHGLAQQYGGRFHLRFDDTNPTTEDVEYVDSIQQDIKWLGADWGECLFFASDYFQRLYDHAVELITQGKAYVDSLSPDEIRQYRGTVTEHGRNSPHRDRSVEDNLDLFRRMREGEFDDGAQVLRAKIDMTSPNMKMRDPPIYRIKKAHHYRTGNEWVVYPLYDFTHCLSDSYEGITHSLCTLEFENNREIYDWVLNNVTVDCKPEQTEFARLHLSYTLLSKRKLIMLVEEGHVSGWDDPRMPTIAGFRRRGVTAEAIRAFCDMIGIAKANSLVDVGKLEYCIRNDLNHRAPRLMCVLRPLEVEITNYDKNDEVFDAMSFPPDVGKEGQRAVPMSRVVYIERDDFMEVPVKGFRRMSPGVEVRLRYGHIIKCDEVVKNDAGDVVKLRCSYAPDAAGRKVKGTIHWVSQAHALDVKVRLYDRLFEVEQPKELSDLNPNSLVELSGCKIEPSAKRAAAGERFQFERQGYFCVDPDSGDGLVFNRTVTLRDTWAKLQARGKQPPERHDRRSKADSAKQSAPSNKGAPAKEQQLSSEQRQIADRFIAKGVSDGDARRLALSERAAALFDQAVAAHDAPQSIANWLVNERALMEDDVPFEGDALGAMVALIDDGTIGSNAAKKVLAKLLSDGGDPRAIVDELGLAQMGDDALGGVVDDVIANSPDEVARYKDGKKALMGFFVGKVMKATKGSADPKLTSKLIRARLDG